MASWYDGVGESLLARANLQREMTSKHKSERKVKCWDPKKHKGRALFISFGGTSLLLLFEFTPCQYMTRSLSLQVRLSLSLYPKTNHSPFQSFNTKASRGFHARFILSGADPVFATIAGTYFMPYYIRKQHVCTPTYSPILLNRR